MKKYWASLVLLFFLSVPLVCQVVSEDVQVRALVNARIREEVTRASCLESENLQEKVVMLANHERYLVVVAGDVSCERYLLILFHEEHYGNGDWSFIQTVEMPLRYAMKPEVEYPEFVERGVHEVLVKGVVVDTGSGMLQKDVIIMKLIDGKLRVVFENSEHVSYSSSDYRVLASTDYQIKNSGSDGVAGYSYLHMIESVSVGRRHIQRVRICMWNGELLHFECVENAPRFSGHVTAGGSFKP